MNLPSPEPTAFWQWILSAAAVLWFVKLVKDLRQPTPEKLPQPMEVKAWTGAPTKEELDKIEKRVTTCEAKMPTKEDLEKVEKRVTTCEAKIDTRYETLQEKLMEGFRQADEARKASISGIYKTMEDRFAKMQEEDTRTRERLAGIEQQNKHTEKTLGEMNAKMDLLLQRLKG